MTGARAISARAALMMALALFMVAGCGDDDPKPTFPTQPEPESGVWFMGIWGSGPDDIFVVGQPGLIFHWDGSSWTQEESPTRAALTDVWGDGSGTVYATGHDGVILRRQSGAWSQMTSDGDVDFFGIGRYRDGIYACGRTDELPVLRRLQGGSWVAAPNEIYQRDENQAVVDTLYLDSEDDPDEIIESLTTVSHYGIAGADGTVLMEDPETAWQYRRLKGGRYWITCSASSERAAGNFLATDGGHMFRLVDRDEQLVWNELYSPDLDAIVYGLHVGEADTVWACSSEGRVTRVSSPYETDDDHRVVYDGDVALFDIWGTSGTNLYAVGLQGRVLHFTDVNGEYQWVIESLPLPATKTHDAPAYDKFGRAVL